ncbi:MAG TPA: VOC family protein [Terracidiphilus sp.]|nr:VOC family protein [Terracidiphilus sp.]
MIFNRSVPTDTVLPHVDYQDVDQAIGWLTKAFGFSEHYRYGNPVSGAQMRLGNAWIMVGRVKPGHSTPKKLGFGTQCLTVFVEDIESHFKRAKSVGVVLLEDLHETEYGELQYAAEDLDGHRWLFSRHARNMDPSQWGATVSQSATMPSRISPMLAVSDGSVAIIFYKAAFNAQVRWQLGTGPDIVAGLAIHGAPFFLAHESPEYGTRDPGAVGHTTVRIELFVDDPVEVQRQALAAGAVEHSPVNEHEHATSGPYPIRRMLQGAVLDPFGHMWLIGKFLE